MESWKKYKELMKEKRTGKGSNTLVNKGNSLVNNENITVQRYTAEVTGKSQKYAKVGARVFVPYLHEDLTVENIKQACCTYFEIGSDYQCDVLAGEQGPSCTLMSQITSLKVIHVRFIAKRLSKDTINLSSGSVELPDLPSKRVKRCVTSSPSRELSKSILAQDVVPKSLSVLDMIKLGSVISTSHTYKIKIFDFSLSKMVWSSTPRLLDFTVDSESFGQGGFRKAYKALCFSDDFSGQLVLKRYLPATYDTLAKTNQTCEEHTKKIVQTHTLASHFTTLLFKKVKELGKIQEFGQVLQYNTIHFGILTNNEMVNEFVTVEQFIEGTFKKYIGNNGLAIRSDVENTVNQKAACLAHFSYVQSNHQLLLTDIQGSSCTLTDPEVASKELLNSNGDFNFCTGNLTCTAINNFVTTHQCNTYCEMLQLEKCKEESP